MTKRNSIIKNSLLIKKKQEKVSIKLEKKGSYKIEGKNKNRKMSLKRRKKEENQFLNTTETNQGSPMAGQKYENVLKENRRE